MTHIIWLKSIIFLKFCQKIDEYISNENANFVIFANGKGLANMTQIIQRHARKCSHDITPALSGYKVNLTKNDKKLTKND